MSRIPLSGIRRMVRLSGVKINSMHNSHLYENLAWILLLTCQRATFSAPRMNVAMQARESDNSHRLSFSRWFLVFGAGLAQRKTKNQRPNGCGPEGSRTPCLFIVRNCLQAWASSYNFVIPLSLPTIVLWTVGDSNSLPLHCKWSVLPGELTAHGRQYGIASRRFGTGQMNRYSFFTMCKSTKKILLCQTFLWRTLFTKIIKVPLR